jgi:hypothetical protein
MPSDKQYSDAAIHFHQEDGTLEIDVGAEVSRSDFDDPEDDPHGAYVKAWVWITDYEANEMPKGK